MLLICHRHLPPNNLLTSVIFKCLMNAFCATNKAFQSWVCFFPEWRQRGRQFQRLRVQAARQLAGQRRLQLLKGSVSKEIFSSVTFILFHSVPIKTIYFAIIPSRESFVAIVRKNPANQVKLRRLRRLNGKLLFFCKKCEKYSQFVSQPDRRLILIDQEITLFFLHFLSAVASGLGLLPPSLAAGL